jgi:hypothetical protein
MTGSCIAIGILRTHDVCCYMHTHKRVRVLNTYINGATHGRGQWQHGETRDKKDGEPLGQECRPRRQEAKDTGSRGGSHDIQDAQGDKQENARSELGGILDVGRLQARLGGLFNGGQDDRASQSLHETTIDCKTTSTTTTTTTTLHQGQRMTTWWLYSFWILRPSRRGCRLGLLGNGWQPRPDDCRPRCFGWYRNQAD